MSTPANAVRLADLPTRYRDIRSDVLNGLRLSPKRLSSKYFYDAAGSALFERICEQPEYYLTRTELAIMRKHIGAISAALGANILLLEYGSGSGAKTGILLSHLHDPVAYVPVELSRAALLGSIAHLSALVPNVEMLPLCADFTETLAPPIPARQPRRTVIYFPGSTLGNFDARQSLALLRRIGEAMGTGGGALIGIDLKKDPQEIEAAYNDAAGVTAQFTLNMLARFNRELGADFDLTRFRHRAHYNALAGRVETHIVSQCDQRIRIAGECVQFAESEAMLVEYSCKYSLEEFAMMADKAGLRVEQVWTDGAQRFSVQYLVRKV